MRIGELAECTGVSERLLRYYEKQSLLAPRRRPNGYREYDENAIDVVRRIRSLLTAGLSTTTIARVMPCLREEGERLIPICPDLLAELRDERSRIDDEIRQLTTSKVLLDALIHAQPIMPMRRP